MRPISLGDRDGGLDPDVRAIQAFRELWLTGDPSFEQFWSGLGRTRSLPLLTALAKVELKARFGRGERPRAAEFFDRFPELKRDGDRVISLVYEEFCLLEESGGDPDTAEFCDRYAPWGDSLRSQLGYHRELSRAGGSSGPSVKFPKPGDRFAAFQLRSLLGTGGASHVYLAIEEALGGRQVALKISSSFGREHEILANLDHPNIVPIHSITDPDETGLRGFVMPYRPGITLEELIRRVGRGRPGRRARVLWDEIGSEAIPAGTRAIGKRPGWREFPIRGTYHEGVAWFGAALADAVAYLHSKGIVHRDIKPANVLLADREGPQVLDFHLAHAPNAPPRAEAALHGGTLPYMAPEQLRAFLDPACWDDVKEPADIYSLGLVLREMVTGRGPELPDQDLPLARAIAGLHDLRSRPAGSVREVNPSIPPSLASIIEMCLAPEPEARYGSAKELAADLQLFLARRPLATAANFSPAERMANFVVRHRIWILSIPILLVLCLAAFTGRPIRQRDFADRAEVRAAVADLDSKDPSRWSKARDAFQRLYEAEPGSAAPALYLGLAYEKLRVPKRATRLIQRASPLPDMGRAVERRLKDGQFSPILLIAEANYFIDQKRLSETEPVLEEILRVDPKYVSALVAYGRLERERRNWAKSVNHFERAITLAEAEPESEGAILYLRTVILPMLNTLGQDELARPGDPAARERAKARYRRLAEHLEALRPEWPDNPDIRGRDMRSFILAFYSAMLECGLAAIEAGEGVSTAAVERRFEAARALLEQARIAIPSTSTMAAGLRSSVDKQLDGLKIRASQPP